MSVDIAYLQALAHRLADGEIDARGYLTALAAQLTRWVGCSRAGLWVFVDTARGPALQCVAMVDTRAGERVVLPTDMVASEHPAYFESLLDEGCVVADDVLTHPAVASYLDEYLRPEDVRSLLDVCHSVNGELFGVVTCEQVGTKAQWSARQLQTVRQVVARAGLTLREASRSLGVSYRRPQQGRPWNDTGWD